MRALCRPYYIMVSVGGAAATRPAWRPPPAALAVGLGAGRGAASGADSAGGSALPPRGSDPVPSATSSVPNPVNPGPLGKRPAQASLDGPRSKRQQVEPSHRVAPVSTVTDARLDAAKEAALALVVEAARRRNVPSAMASHEGRQRLALLYAAGAASLMTRLGIRQSVPRASAQRWRVRCCPKYDKSCLRLAKLCYHL